MEEIMFAGIVRRIRLLMILLAGVLFWAALAPADPTPTPTPSPRFVDGKAAPGGDGLSWTTAFSAIQPAVDAASAAGGGEVWVAEGTYTYTGTGTGDQVVNIPAQVKVYGGFAGSESALAERNPATHKTIIDGQKGRRGVNNSGLLDGFVVQNGYSSSSNGGMSNGGGVYNTNYGTVTGCTVTGNSASLGGGIYSSSSMVTSCTVTGNSAKSGGGIYNSGSTATNCMVTSNSASGDGGGVYNNIGAAMGCTVTDNSANRGGGVYNDDKLGIVTGCTVIGNSAKSGGGVFNNIGTALYNNGTLKGNPVTDCIVWRNCGTDIVGDLSKVTYSCFGEATADNHNLRANPRFVSTAGENPLAWDLRLGPDSPCIDAGTTATQGLPATDIQGNPRPGGDGRVDLGAYESPDAYTPGTPAAPVVLYVSPQGDGTTGQDWTKAFQTITSAIEATQAGFDLYEIRVAKGTYHEGREIFLPGRISLVGGWSGNPSNPQERNVAALKAILDGDKNHRCLTNYGQFDGLWIQNGSADQGGGIYNCYPGTVTGCTVTGCTATGNSVNQSNGGGIYNNSGTVTGCTVAGNAACGRGGGIYNAKAFSYTGTVTGCTVTSNSASDSGGGVYNNLGTVTGCTVAGNSASDGGGVCNYVLVMPNGSNRLPGGGIPSVYYGTVTNCIVWHNIMSDVGSLSGVTYSCFGEATGDNHNLRADPRFVSTTGVDPLTWDLRLKPDSPCIDAGTTEALSLSTTDLAGNSRPGSDGRVDMGAYESPDAYTPGMPAAPVVLYVSPQGDGTTGQDWTRAFQSVTSATQTVQTGYYDLYEIRVAAGTYREGREIFLPGRASLVGGWSGNPAKPEERNGATFKTIIDGEKKYRCLTNYGHLDGLWLQNGSAIGGSGVYNWGTVTDCTVTGNSATYGGGVYNWGTMAGCMVTSNSISGSYCYGGGVYNEGKVTGCTVTGNSANGTNESGYGGGIFNDLDSGYFGTVTGCMVAGNSASGGGGGVYNTCADNSMTNCTVTGNSAVGGGGVLNCFGIVTNCIVWGNRTTDIEGAGGGGITYSCFGEATGDNHNLRADPRFVSTAGTDPLAWDLRLRPDSPCLGAGTTEVQNLPATDILGNPRLGSDGHIDMGAYEGAYAPPTPTPTPTPVVTATPTPTPVVTPTPTPTPTVGTVAISVSPPSVAWTLTDGKGLTHQGTGNALLGGISAGALSLAWAPPAGYDPPASNPALKTLAVGACVSFSEVFVPATDGTARKNALVLRYLLGLSNDPTGLDTNGDQKVTVADLVRTNVDVLPPTRPAAPSPADRATTVSVTANLDWADSTRGRSYDVYLWSGATKPATASKAGLSTSFFDPPTSLTYGTKYSWQVVVRNGTDQTAGLVWSFTTKPQPVQLISPNTDQTWTRGSTVQIHWKLIKSLAGTAVRLELWRNNVRVMDLGRTSALSGEATSRVPVPISLTAGTGYKLRVVSLLVERRPAGEAWDQGDGSITIK